MLSHLSIANGRSPVFFLWVPSHTGLAAYETVNNLAKIACALDMPEIHATEKLYTLNIMGMMNEIAVFPSNVMKQL